MDKFFFSVFNKVKCEPFTYDSLEEITPKTREQKAKVVVVEKMMSHTALHSPNKYQRLVLTDSKVRKSFLKNKNILSNLGCYNVFPYCK